jgi:hypothetical protein
VLRGLHWGERRSSHALFIITAINGETKTTTIDGAVPFGEFR